jgi:hypothetical protein
MLRIFGFLSFERMPGKAEGKEKESVPALMDAGMMSQSRTSLSAEMFRCLHA